MYSSQPIMEIFTLVPNRAQNHTVRNMMRFASNRLPFDSATFFHAMCSAIVASHFSQKNRGNTKSTPFNVPPSKSHGRSAKHGIGHRCGTPAKAQPKSLNASLQISQFVLRTLLHWDAPAKRTDVFAIMS